MLVPFRNIAARVLTMLCELTYRMFGSYREFQI